mmetsp:Transcript_37568/g.111471  ORF Transcript_37568/g.111471 Transcript_37568/m.111471 type:complete len:262 (-) Transcript_37568:400-1185(-)
MFCRSRVFAAAPPGFGVGGMFAALAAAADTSAAGAAGAPPTVGTASPTTVGTPCWEWELISFFMISRRLFRLAPVPVAPKSLSCVRFRDESWSCVNFCAGAGSCATHGSTVMLSSWPTSWKPCMDVMASCASVWLLNVIQHSCWPILNSSNSPKGLKMPCMSSSVTTGRRFLMWSFRMFGPVSWGAPPVLRPASTCWVNSWRVIMRFGAGALFFSCSAAFATVTAFPRISLRGGGIAQARLTASSSRNSTITVPVGLSKRL